MERHESKTFNVNFGTKSGTDILSTDGSVAAEVFAAVKYDNNNKLKKDINRVAELPAEHKYVFFYSHNKKLNDDKLLEYTKNAKSKVNIVEIKKSELELNIYG